MAKSRGRKFAELVAPTNGVFAAASIPTIALSKLATSAVTINSESLSLGGSLTLDTSDIGEHTSNKYFTDTRAQASISVASNSGHGALAYDNSNGQFTFAGITTEAIQDVVGAMFSSNTETAVTVTYQDSDGTIDLIVDDTTKLPLAGGTLTGNLTLGDNVNAYFGASTDLRIYHDGTNSHIINSTGELRVTGSNIAIKSDSAKLYFGASDDLQIYHDGSHSFISDQGTGHLKLLAGNFRVNNSADNAQLISAESGGAVYLFHNNAVKIETTSTGVAITGLATMTTGTASSKFAVGTATVHGSYAFYNNSNSYFNGAVTVDDTLSANKLVSLDGVLELDDNGTHNGIINSPASLRVNIDSDNGGTGESFAVGHNQTAINANNKLFEVNDSGQVTINNAFTFPTSDGTNGQVLQTNGSGVLSWSSAAGGGSVWSSSGSDIYYTSGEVGIGTNSPNQIFHIKNTGQHTTMRIENDNADFLIQAGDAGDDGLHFYDLTNTAYRMTIDNSGQVGIGTTTPGSALQINSTDNQKIIFSGSNDPYIRWQEGTTNKGYMQWNAAGYFELRNEEVSSYWTLGDAFALNPTTDEAFVIERSGDALRQHIKNTNTTGTYSYLQLSTVNSSSAQDSGYLLKNAAQNTGNSLGNNSLYLWNQSAEVELVPSGTIANRFTVDTSGDLTIRGASTTGILGAAYSTNYFGLKTSGQTLSSEYMIISSGTDTYISATSGYPVYIRYGGNNSTNQLVVGSGATNLTWRGSTVWTAENDGASSGLFSQYTNTLVGTGGINNAVSTNHVEYSGQISSGTTGLFNASNNANGILRLNTHPGNYYHDLGFSSDGNMYHRNFSNSNAFTTAAWYKVWDASNDGTGSGLDADLLDGVQGSKIQQALARNAGWEPAYSNSDEASVYYDYSERAIVIDGTNDSANGAAFKAVRVEAGEELRFTVQIKGSTAGSSGMYIRLYAHHGELPNGKTHVSNDAGSSAFVQEDDSGDTGWYENGSIGASYVSYTRTYTASQTAFVSLVILNWSNYGSNKLYVRNPDISILKVNDSHALDGSTAGKYMKTGAGDAVSGWWISSARNGNSGSPQIYFSHSSGYGQHINTYNTDGSIYALQVHNNSSEIFGVYNDGQVRISGNLRIGPGANDGYFYSDSNGRTAFAGGDLYIQNSVSNYYNYATNQYIGDSSGDNIYFRGNVLSGTGWGINGAGKLTTRDHQITAGYHLQRSDHHSGHLEGSYNNVGENSSKTNPIYTIGSSYNPGESGLSNMYGIGYTHPNASFINFTGDSGWGMYVAADGDARVWLDGSAGVISSTGHHYVGSNVVWNAGNDGSGSGLDADNLDGVTWGSYKSTGATYVNVQAANGYGLRFWNGSDNYKTYMSSASASGAGRVSGDSNSDYNMYFKMTGGTNRGFVFQNGTSNRGGIDGGGNARFSGNVTAYASDIRLKKNIKPIENALDKLIQIRGVTFDWKEDIEDFVPKCKTETGVIAQEIETVIPDAISPAPFNSEYKTVEKDKIIALLIESVKELKSEVDYLKQQLKEK